MAVACPACKTSLPIRPEQNAGKQLRCPACRVKFTTPDAPTQRVQPPPPPLPKAATAPIAAPEAPAGLVTGKRIILAVMLVVLVLPAFGLTWFVVSRARTTQPSQYVVQAPTPRGSGTTELPDVEKPSGSN